MIEPTGWSRGALRVLTPVLLLTGCGGGATRDGVPPDARPMQALSSVTAAAPEQLQPTAGIAMTGTVRAAMFEGTVQAIHRDRRQITVRLADGKVVRVRVGNGADEFASLKPGTRISFQLRETVEITRDRSFHPETGHVVDRFPAGSMADREYFSAYRHRPPTGHHSLNWSDVIEVPAKVVAVDPGSRTIRLVTYDGRYFTVRLSDPRIDLADFTTGEAVVAHFREVDELDVLDTP